MAGFILVVDDRGRIRPIVERAVRGADVRVFEAHDFASAKRTLVQAVPNLILCAVDVGGNPQGGYNFCQELQTHADLGSVPVMFVANALTEDVIRTATESGARGLIPWPVAPQMLRARMTHLLPELTETEYQPDEVEEPPHQPQPQEPPPPPPPPSSSAQPATVDPETEEKLLHAQRLLAQVLHNLKTSDLLGIVDLDDVPRVVFEMTRTVCGVSTEQAELEQASPPTQETSLDLEGAFGMKK